MPQSRSTVFLRHQKKERWGIINDKTNDTYGSADAQRRTATEEPPWKGSSKHFCHKAYRNLIFDGDLVYKFRKIVGNLIFYIILVKLSYVEKNESGTTLMS